MTNETIVAVYDTVHAADAAVSDLEAAGVPSSAITRHSGTSATAVSGATTSEPVEPVRERGFWSNLFGGEPDHDSSIYDRSVQAGSSVVVVKISDEHMQQMTEILERHTPVDLDERAASYGLGTATTTTTTTTAEPSGYTAASGATARPGTIATGAMPAATGAVGETEVLALAEEELTVGKRLVNRGTTRIRRFVVETPVEEAVSLRSEHVSVERRPVATGTPVGNADFTDRTIEVTETEEEAVIAKTARVKEEVVINKSAEEHVETVRDTVRREDVEITRDGGTVTTSGTTAAGTIPTTPTNPKI